MGSRRSVCSVRSIHPSFPTVWPCSLTPSWPHHLHLFHLQKIKQVMDLNAGKDGKMRYADYCRAITDPATKK